ncbi:MAG: DUF3488 domain-containing protein [Deltaproteobacteria bacterium]|nr:DUF3488 domain-containing protein [Deltaproteobacteria bacterium]
MKFSLIHRLSLFALAATGVLPLILSGELGSYLGPAFAVCMAAGWFLPERLMNKPKYRAVATAMLVVIFAVQCVRIFQGTHLATATIEFSVLILAVKLCMRSEFGDFQQIVLMSFIALIASTVTSYNVSFALIFVVFTILSPVAMFLTQMRKEMETRFTRADESVRQRLFNSARIVTGKNLGIPFTGALGLLLLIAAVFAVIPRWGIGAGGGILPGKPFFGFTDEVKIGDLSQTMEKKDVFLRLWPKKKDASGPDRMNVKFRGQVFDTWKDGSWHSGQNRAFRYFSAPSGVFVLQAAPPASGPRFTVMQASTEPAFLFVPTQSHTVSMAPLRRRGYVYYPRIQVNGEGVLKYSDQRKVGIRYDVLMGTQPFAVNDIVRMEAYLQLPVESQRLARLARQWTRNAASPPEQVTRIVAHFQREFGYIKTIPEAERAAAEEDNIVDRFLFSYRRGTCEHFATASVLMFRSLGIPARFVTGFQGGQWNGVGEYYTVDASNAHAWTEVFFSGRWHTVDPTPVRAGAGGTGGASGAGASAYLSQWLDTLSMHWHEYVIDYSETTQRNLIAGMLPGTPGGQRSLDALRLPRYLVLAALLSIIGFAAIKRKQLRHFFKQLRAKKTNPALMATSLFNQLEARLTPVIGARKMHQTPQQYLMQAVAAAPHLTTLIGEFLALYHQDRFGGRPMSPVARRELKVRISQLRIEKSV